ncbi:phosphatidylinositol glycan anchor biosynthesis class Q isoform X3 [Rhodnius prolixus]|uniref:phosphatidylinositol glycan anchor biosynthesis class Q isoform X3 n=1 Tax=Rhodnius prolixus TaxID=13249 RepID=UPI003D18DC2A
MENLLIFIPDSLKKCESDYLIGIFDGQKNNSVCKSLYIFGVQSLYCKSVVKSYPIVGCYKNKSEFFPGFRRRKNFVVVSYKKEVTVKKVIINHESFNLGLVRPLLEVAFFTFLKIGLLGLSYQIAILGDIFSVVSFHVYCIYIYAAKLYYWQVSGLYSLSRIFLGRNQNPQPGKVDSCPYTTEQLFVGTICFTVLLFLLPTTLVYYIVFTLMRLGVNIVGGVMTRARYFIQALPLYSTLVWIFNPKFTAVTLTLTPVSSLSTAGTVTLIAYRGNTSLYEVFQKCTPDIIKKPPEVNWKEIGWNIVVGKLIYPL